MLHQPELPSFNKYDIWFTWPSSFICRHGHNLWLPHQEICISIGKNCYTILGMDLIQFYIVCLIYFESVVHLFIFNEGEENSNTKLINFCSIMYQGTKLRTQQWHQRCCYQRRRTQPCHQSLFLQLSHLWWGQVWKCLLPGMLTPSPAIQTMLLHSFTLTIEEASSEHWKKKCLTQSQISHLKWFNMYPACGWWHHAGSIAVLF